MGIKPQVPDGHGRMVKAQMDSTHGSGVPRIKVDLSLVSFEDLWQELCKRHDYCAFVGKIDKTVPQYLLSRKYKGSRFQCLGIIDLLKRMVEDEEINGLGPVIES